MPRDGKAKRARGGGVPGSPWFARLYDAVMTPADGAGLARGRERLAAGATGRVLEIGAGTGLEFRHYPPGLEVYAIEPDVAMLARARPRAQESAARVTLVVADAQALPFRGGAFDTAVSALAFCTIPDPGRAAAEMRRVLRRTGVAYLLEHVRARHRALAWVQAGLTPIWKRVAGGCHLDRPTPRIIGDAGFDVEVRRAELDGVMVELAARPRGAGRAAGAP